MTTFYIVRFIHTIFRLYMWLIVGRVILSFIRPRSYNPIVRFIYDVTEPLLGFCRRILPGTLANLDFSPLVAVLLLDITRYLLITIITSIF